MIKIDWDSLGFNVIETKSMFKATCKQGETWKEGGLVPYGKIGIISSCWCFKLWTRML